MKQKIKVAFIGAGYMAQEHIKVFSSFHDVELSGIVSRSIKKCIDLSKEFKILNIYNSIDELYKIAKPDLLVICVPELECKSICKIAFKYNWKVIIEKPAGYNSLEAKEIIDLANYNNCQAYVGLNRRHYSSTTKIKKLIDDFPEKRLVRVLDQEDTLLAQNSGQPKKVIDNWMYANSIHLIDYFKIFCRGHLINVENLIDWDLEKSNFVLSKLNFSSGDVGLYQCNWNSPGPWSVSLNNNKIFIEMKPLENATYQLLGSRKIFELEIDEFDNKYKPGLYLQAKEAIKAVKNKRNKLVSIDEGYKTMELVRLIYKLSS